MTPSTAVSLWVAEGANPKHVAAMAGHTSVSVVLDRYGHLYPQQDDELCGDLRLAPAYRTLVSGDELGVGRSWMNQTDDDS